MNRVHFGDLSVSKYDKCSTSLHLSIMNTYITKYLSREACDRRNNGQARIFLLLWQSKQRRLSDPLSEGCLYTHKRGHKKHNHFWSGSHTEAYLWSIGDRLLIGYFGAWLKTDPCQNNGIMTWWWEITRYIVTPWNVCGEKCCLAGRSVVCLAGRHTSW